MAQPFDDQGDRVGAFADPHNDPQFGPTRGQLKAELFQHTRQRRQRTQEDEALQSLVKAGRYSPFITGVGPDSVNPQIQQIPEPLKPLYPDQNEDGKLYGWEPGSIPPEHLQILLNMAKRQEALRLKHEKQHPVVPTAP